MKVISFRKTVVGWINFTTEAGATYNINPVKFRQITGVSEQAVMGCCELTKNELEELTEQARLIKMPAGYEWVSA